MVTAPSPPPPGAAQGRSWSPSCLSPSRRSGQSGWPSVPPPAHALGDTHQPSPAVSAHGLSALPFPGLIPVPRSLCLDPRPDPGARAHSHPSTHALTPRPLFPAALTTPCLQAHGCPSPTLHPYTCLCPGPTAAFCPVYLLTHSALGLPLSPPRPCPFPLVDLPCV